MYTLAAILAVISLAPAALYVIGRIRDPFHPLILIGVLSYFMVPHRIFTEGSAILTLLPERLYDRYLLVSILSVLGVYAGWWYSGRRLRRREALSPKPVAPPRQYHASQLMLFATLCALVGTGIHFVFYEQFDISGYIMDLKMLWITGAILSVQCFFLSPQLRFWSVLVFAISIAPPVERFIVYGQRGDTFRLAVLAELAYLTTFRRPTKVVFVSAAVILGLTLATLVHTRGMVESLQAPNRIAALEHVIPHFFDRPTAADVNGSEEFIYGAASIETVRLTDSYGYGRGLTSGLIARFLPRHFFPDKDQWVTPHFGFDYPMIHAMTTLVVPGGSAPSGFANGYDEFGWACALPWIIMGYFTRRLWDLVNRSDDLLYQGLFAGLSMAILYAISQDLLTAEVNLIYSFVPLLVIYRLARVPNTALYGLPEMNLE